jgi:hypothetical protein
MYLRFFASLFLLFLLNCSVTENYVDKGQSNLNSGLIIHYPLDGNGIDISGNENHFRLNGPSSTSDRKGESNKALYFDGIDDFVEIPNDTTITNSDKSISFWFYKSDSKIDRDSKGNYLEALLYKGFDTSYAREYSFEITQADQPFNIQFQVGEETNDILIATKRDRYINSSKWYHIVGTIKAEGDLKLFIDGEIVQHTLGLMNPVYNEAPITIGKASSNSLRQRYFNGKIDDLRIYNRVLSENEVKELFTLDE